MVNKLTWCFAQKKGIRLVKPNENLAKEYLKSSEETLRILKNIKDKSNMWLATTKYYCEYFAVYALLMYLGVRSEIHDCTIELVRFLEKEKVLPRGTAKQLENDKELRIENQYYLKNKKVKIDFDKLRDFLLLVKDKISTLTFNEIEEIRNKIRRLEE